MSEAAGAPAAAAPTSTNAPPAQAKQPDAAPVWSDKDDADLIDRLKKAPWAKIKANGEEKRIESKEDWLSYATDAARGRGANKVVEEAKKAKAEAAEAKREAEGIKQTLERARRGDEAALRELRLIRDEAEDMTQEQFDALPEPVKRQLMKARELEQLEGKRRTEDEQRQHEEREKAKLQRREKVLTEARAIAKEVLADVREEMHDVEVPEIISAMHALREVGQKFGVDYTKEQLSAFVQQRRQAALTDRLGSLKPDAAMKMVVPALKSLITSPEGLATLEKVLGADFEAVAGALSGYRLTKWKAARQKAATQPVGTSNNSSGEEPPARRPMDPYRRW